MIKPYAINRNGKYTSVIVGGFFVVWIVLFISSWLYSVYLLHAIKGPGIITKVEMRIASNNGQKRISITDTQQLYRIDTALKKAKEFNGHLGGLSEIWASICLYKNGKKLYIDIIKNPYNGWVLDVHNKTLRSGYLFQLVESYVNGIP